MVGRVDRDKYCGGLHIVAHILWTDTDSRDKVSVIGCPNGCNPDVIPVGIVEKDLHILRWRG